MNRDKYLDELFFAGVLVDEAIERCMGDAALYKKFLKTFPKDEKMEKLKDALETEDYKAAEFASHSLKGITGNLGFDGLYKKFSKITDDIRSGKYRALYREYEDVTVQYDEICSIINKYSD